MTYTKDLKYEHDGGRSQGRMMNCVLALLIFFIHFSICDSLSELLVVMRCVCPCMLFMCKCLMYLMSHSWLRFCLYCHTVTVYMREWFVYCLSKDQFPLYVHITAAGYFQGWNCPSEHLRELLNVLFTQH